MEYFMAVIIILGSLFWIINHPLIVLLILIASCFVLVVFFRVRLSTVLFYFVMGGLLLYSFMEDAEDASLRKQNNVENKTSNTQNTNVDNIETNIDNNINANPTVQILNNYPPKYERKEILQEETSSDSTIKNLNELLKNPENLNPGDKEKLERMREQRIKQLMDEKGQSIINEYNKNNPQPSSLIRNNADGIPMSNSSLNKNENNQTKPRDSFIETMK